MLLADRFMHAISSVSAQVRRAQSSLLRVGQLELGEPNAHIVIAGSSAECKGITSVILAF